MMMMTMITTIIFFFFLFLLLLLLLLLLLHGLGRLICYGIDALPSFPGVSTISSSSRLRACFGSLVLYAYECNRFMEDHSALKNQLMKG
jgi:hypothetical protein